jgi:hypothetical protein
MIKDISHSVEYEFETTVQRKVKSILQSGRCIFFKCAHCNFVYLTALYDH